MAVCFSGPLLSHFLLDATARYKGDAEGFLLGHTASGAQKDGTAQQSAAVEEFVICKQPFSFYNKQGQVDLDELRRQLKGNWEKLIGWFRVRRSSPLHVSIRERSIHESLQQYCTNIQHSAMLVIAAILSGKNVHLGSRSCVCPACSTAIATRALQTMEVCSFCQVVWQTGKWEFTTRTQPCAVCHSKWQQLLFAVFNGSVSSTLATQSFGYGIWTLHGSHFIPCKVTITNLGHTGKSEYQQPTAVSLTCSSPLYHQVISTHRGQFQDQEGQLQLVTDITNLYTSMLDRLQGLCSSLGCSDYQIQQLHHDIEGLHNAIGRKNRDPGTMGSDSLS